MFGLFKRKSLKSPVCGYCGDPRPIVHTREAGADDLLKNSKLSRGDYTVVCQKCASSIGARYDHQPDYSTADASPGSVSLSTGEQEYLAEAPTETISSEHYEPGNGYRTDDEIREDDQPDEKLTVYLFGSSVDIPAPVRRALPRLALFFAIYLVLSFWPDRETGSEPSTQGAPVPTAINSDALSGATIPAMPAGNPGEWISSGDYPTAALREERSGTVEFQLQISETGEIAACNIMESSGHADLDKVTCRALMRRARFNPAQNASGEPVRSSYINKVRWQIPQ